MNEYKGCATCANATRRHGLKCLEGRRASYMGHVTLPCWKPKEKKTTTTKGKDK